MLVVAYDIRATEMGTTYWKRQRIRVQCLDCGVEVKTGLLLTHYQSEHAVVRGYHGGVTPPTPPPGEARTHWISFPKILSQI